MDDIASACYLRIPTVDRPGVFAQVASALSAHSISIEAVIQKEAISETVPIIILTHSAEERQLNKAIDAIEALEDVAGKTKVMKKEFYNPKTFNVTKKFTDYCLPIIGKDILETIAII